jgi:ferric-dicitrate binding protein FerR (iron transport regulator)
MDRLEELTTRSLSGEATPEELKELEQILASDSKALARYRLLQQFWNQHDAVSQPAVEEALQKTLAQLQLSPAVTEDAQVIPIRRNWPRRIAVAAAFIIIGSAAYWFISRNESTTSSNLLVEKHNARGTKSTIELTDGSKIWLNADSKISYPEVFTGNTREVYLNGEAFFDVAKNPSKPFIIHLANGTVRVLGTSFNVRAYDNEKVVETSVSTGKVAFIPKYQSHKQKQDTLFITPNNKVRYSLEEDQANLLPTAAAEDKAWTEGRLIFKGLTLQEIAIELERHFGKKVTFVDDEPKNYRLTGSFQNNSLDEIMFYLSKTKDFKYKITNSELLIGTD